MSTIAAPRHRWRRCGALLLVAAAVIAACGGDSRDSADTPGSDMTAADAAADPAGDETSASLQGTVRLGYFPNVTHAPALVGVAEGTFSAALGPNVELQTFTFNAGTEAIEALLAESLDVTFIGPNPAINAFAKSGDDAERIVSGSTSGGAFLVVTPEIDSIEQLAGTTLATPSLGNTQDVALRAWLNDNGLESTPEGGGDVAILPQGNSTTFESFISGAIDGAWVPEPWATRLVEEGGGRVLVDERDLWPDTDGEYVTTHVIVRTDFLNDHPDLVKAVLVGLADAVDAIAADPVAAQDDVVAQITEITGSAPHADTIATSFSNLTFTLDPIAVSLQKSADDAVAVGLLDPVDLDGIYDLALLDEVLAERGKPKLSEL